MACGCAEFCNCCVADTDTVSWTGTGATGNCHMATVIPDPAGCITNTPDGIAIVLDPASPAPISCGPEGLSVECCPVCVVDSDTIDFSLPGGCVSGEVILGPDGALESTAAGVAIKPDPASPATVSVGPNGLSVGCCEAGDAILHAVNAYLTDDQSVTGGSHTMNSATYPWTNDITVGANVAWDAANNRPFAAVDGVYRVSAYLELNATSATDEQDSLGMVLRNSGTTFFSTLWQQGAGLVHTGTVRRGFSHTQLVQMTSGQYIEVRTTQNSTDGDNYTVVGESGGVQATTLLLEYVGT